MLGDDDIVDPASLPWNSSFLSEQHGAQHASNYLGGGVHGLHAYGNSHRFSISDQLPMYDDSVPVAGAHNSHAIMLDPHAHMYDDQFLHTSASETFDNISGYDGGAAGSAMYAHGSAAASYGGAGAPVVRTMGQMAKTILGAFVLLSGLGILIYCAVETNRVFEKNASLSSGSASGAGGGRSGSGSGSGFSGGGGGSGRQGRRRNLAVGYNNGIQYIDNSAYGAGAGVYGEHVSYIQGTAPGSNIIWYTPGSSYYYPTSQQGVIAYNASSTTPGKKATKKRKQVKTTVDVSLNAMQKEFLKNLVERQQVLDASFERAQQVYEEMYRRDHDLTAAREKELQELRVQLEIVTSELNTARMLSTEMMDKFERERVSLKANYDERVRELEEKISNLEMQLLTLREEKRDIESKLRALENQVTIESISKSQLEEQKHHLEEQLLAIQSKLEIASSSLTSEQQALQQSNASFRSEMRRMQSEHDAALNNLNMKIHELENQNTKLLRDGEERNFQHQLAEQRWDAERQQFQLEKKRLQEERERLQRELLEKDRINHEQHQQVLTLQGEVKQAERRHARLERQIQEHQNRVSHLEAELAAAKLDLNWHKSRIGELTAQLRASEETVRQLTSQIASLKTTEQYLKQQLQTSETKYSRELLNAQEKERRSETKILDLTSEIRRLEIKMQDSENIRASRDRLEREVQELKNTLAQKKAEAWQFRSDMDTLRMNHEEEQHKLRSEMSSVKATMGRLQKEKNDADANARKLQTQLTVKNEEVSRLQQEMDGIRLQRQIEKAELKQTSEHYFRLIQTLEQQKATCDGNCRHRHEQQQSRIEQLINEKETLQNENLSMKTRFEQEIEQLNARTEDCRWEWSTAVEKHQKERNELMKRISELEQSIEKNEANGKKTDTHEMQQTIQQLKIELSQAQHALQESEQRHSSTEQVLKTNLQLANEQKSELEHQIAKHERTCGQRNAELEAELARLTALNSQYEEEKKSLQAENASFRQKLKEYEAQAERREVTYTYDMTAGGIPVSSERGTFTIERQHISCKEHQFGHGFYSHHVNAKFYSSMVAEYCDWLEKEKASNERQVSQWKQRLDRESQHLFTLNFQELTAWATEQGIEVNMVLRYVAHHYAMQELVSTQNYVELPLGYAWYHVVWMDREELIHVLNSTVGGADAAQLEERIAQLVSLSVQYWESRLAYEEAISKGEALKYEFFPAGISVAGTYILRHHISCTTYLANQPLYSGISSQHFTLLVQKYCRWLAQNPEDTAVRAASAVLARTNMNIVQLLAKGNEAVQEWSEEQGVELSALYAYAGHQEALAHIRKSYASIVSRADEFSWYSIHWKMTLEQLYAQARSLRISELKVQTLLKIATDYWEKRLQLTKTPPRKVEYQFSVDWDGIGDGNVSIHRKHITCDNILQHYNEHYQRKCRQRPFERMVQAFCKWLASNNARETARINKVSKNQGLAAIQASELLQWSVQQLVTKARNAHVSVNDLFIYVAHLRATSEVDSASSVRRPPAVEWWEIFMGMDVTALQRTAKAMLPASTDQTGIDAQVDKLLQAGKQYWDKRDKYFRDLIVAAEKEGYLTKEEVESFDDE